ncbi:MAG TPA: DUF4431 domain-containing protein [Terriglobales bacterium]|nr:DUF4431 domain-containing protein [Terriglobales bacterium]
MRFVDIGITAAGTLLVWSGVCLGQTSQKSDCLSYEPAVVKITGILIRKTFPGPPNYESIQRGDRAETSWFLDLPATVCVNEDRTKPGLNPGQRDVHEIQLVLQPEQYSQHKALVGGRVVATGTLFGEHTGHHHTPVLLTVRTLEKESK